jgi:hypothetical protein
MQYELGKQGCVNLRDLSVPYVQRHDQVLQVSSAGKMEALAFGLGFFIKQLFLRFGMYSLPIVDHLIFNKIKQRLGGRVKLLLSGGAPLAQHLEHFLKVTMCCPVTQVVTVSCCDFGFCEATLCHLFLSCACYPC